MVTRHHEKVVWRGLVLHYEHLPETWETFIYIAMIRIMVRRLA